MRDGQRRKCAFGSRASVRSAEQRRSEQSWWIMTPDRGRGDKMSLLPVRARPNHSMDQDVGCQDFSALSRSCPSQRFVSLGRPSDEGECWNVGVFRLQPAESD